MVQVNEIDRELYGGVDVGLFARERRALSIESPHKLSWRPSRGMCFHYFCRSLKTDLLCHRFLRATTAIQQPVLVGFGPGGHDTVLCSVKGLRLETFIRCILWQLPSR
jgi:hypothetical protein